MQTKSSNRSVVGAAAKQTRDRGPVSQQVKVYRIVVIKNGELVGSKMSR